MATTRAALLWAGLLATVFSGVASAQQATPTGPSIPIEYCASVNTADMDPLNSNFQSEGRCFGNCTTLNYALAIVQEKNCWCSNLIPNKADRKSLSDCEYSCPGYPSDYCGGDGVFGYLAVSGLSPTGTAAAVNSATSSADASSSTIQPTSTVKSSGSSSSVSSTSSSSSSATSSDSTTSQQPVIQTVTIGGTVKTVVVTPSPTTSSDASLAGTTRSSGLQTGAIVGIVVGVVGGLAVIAAFLWLWFSKRRRRGDFDEKDGHSPVRSTAGSTGPLGTPKTGETSEGRYGAAAGPAVGWDASNKRRSFLMPVDPRLDPYAKGIYGGDQSRSRESFNSLQDNQDYSRRVAEGPRVLRATNPDPDDD